MPESINSKLKEQYDHDDSGGSLDTNLGDFLDSEGASGTSNNSKWRDWASGTGTSLNTRLFHKHGGSGSFMTRWKNWIAFSSTHSINLDGSNDYLSFDQDIAVSGDFSVSWWMYVTDETQGFAPLFYKAGNYVLYFRDNGDFLLRINSFGGVTFNSASVVSENQWHHFALVRSGSDVDLYVDGESINDTETVSGGSFTFNQIGFDGSSSYLDALIDEVAVWDTALSASDVTSIYNNGKVIDLSKSASYGVDRTGNLKLWLRCGDKAEPESNTAIARQDFYTDFDGTDDYINVGSDSSIDDIWTGGGTLTAWIYPRSDGESDFGMIAVKRNGNTSGWYLATNDESGGVCDIRLRSARDTADGSWATTSREITLNEWNHIAVSYDSDSDSNNALIYVNGISVAVTETDTPSGSHSSDASDVFKIGGEAGAFTYDGKISNLALHQTILDAQTISQMAKSRFTPMRDNRFSVMDFDGADDKITFTRQVFTGAFTISWWFNGDTQTFYQRMFNDSTSANNNILTKDSNGLVTIRINGTYRANISGVPHNEWCHLAFTRDGSGNIKSYLNGVASGTATDTDEFALDFIGEQVVCSIASASMYNVEKSAEEIYAIYQQGITYDESSLSGLVGYWRMGDDTSKAYPTIVDSSSNSNDGTITNGASDDIVQQMLAGYDMGAFESSSEQLSGEIVNDPSFDTDLANGATNANFKLSGDGEITNGAWSFTSGGGVGRLTVMQDASTQYTFVSGKLYKLQFTIVSSGNALLNLDFVNSSYINYGNGTHTLYAVGDGGVFQIQASGSGNSFTLTDISFKEVLQSEVSDTHPAIIDVNEPVLGVDVIVNGDFDTDSDWSKGTGWTISDGKARCDGTQTGNTNLQTSVAPLSSGKMYKITFDLTRSAGNFRFLIGSSGSSDYYTTDGTHSFYKVEDGNDHVYAQGDSNFVGTLDNVIVKEVKGNVGTMTNQDSADLVYSSVLPDQSFLTGLNSAYNYFDFGGTDEYIDTPQSVNTYPFSVSAWVKPLSGQTAYIFSIADINTDSEYKAIFWSNATSKFTMIDRSSGIFNKISGALSADTWHHVVAVFASTSSRSLYVNGVINESSESSGTSGGFTSNLDNQAIGALRRSSGANYGVVEIGQTAIWNKELSSTEVLAIYNAGRHSNLLDSYSDNLKGYWAMSALDAKTGLSDVGNGTIYDRSGNSNHGTATNTESADLKSSPNAEPNGYAKGDTNRLTTTP